MRNVFFTIGVFFLSLLTTSAFAQQDAFLKDFLERWVNSKKYTIEVATAMPESEYNFKPTAEEMTFAEQLMHIASIIDWHAFSKIDGQGFKPRFSDFKVEGRSRKEMIEIIKREFARTDTLILNFKTARLGEIEAYGKFKRTRRQLFMLMTDHVTHHRAQLLVYLRLKGITPPVYQEFQ